MPNEAEFIRIIKDNEGLIFKVSSVYTDDTEDMKDLYQEIVYQFWKSFDSFRNEAKISTWMYRIALNTSIAHLNRRKKKFNHVPLDKSIFQRIDHTDYGMEEQVNMLYATIRKLNSIEKGIILLHLEGKTYEEISVITGFTATNVGTKLNRIREKLRTQIKQ